MNALDWARQIASGERKAVNAIEDAFLRIEQSNEQIGAFLSLDKEHAQERAGQIDAQIAAGKSVGPLAGVPVALKDNMCLQRGKTTCGSKMLEHFQAPYDAHVVQRLEAAGAIIVGKCNMDEFAMGSSTENSALGKTVNPRNTECVPGGSSGGSAASVASGMVPLALGSDTGGSIRQPAAYCGLIGMKPTYGRVSRYGLVAFGSSLDQIGPFAGNVTDAALLLSVIAGHDERDSTSVSETVHPVPDYLSELDQPIENLRIGVAPEFFELEGLDPVIKQAVQQALAQFEKQGAELVEVHIPHLKYAIGVYYLVATAEASSNLARFDGVHYGYRTPDPADYIDLYSASRAEALGEEVQRRIMLGTYALSSGYYDAYYLKALKARNLIRQDFNKALESVDCLISPTTPEPAFKFGEKGENPLTMYLSDIYTVPANLAGNPAISVPCGRTDDGMPIGMQIITPPFTEGKLLRIARYYEVADVS